VLALAAAVVHATWNMLVARARDPQVATALAGVIGGSRIFLQVHWFSDVAGGWALGAAIFGLGGAAGLIVDHFRHNERAPAPPATAAARATRERVSPLRH
jgi:membrane-associated phospholipid phosphatase